MDQYNYPAIFTEKADGSISVTFPDFPEQKVKECNMIAARNKARNALCFILAQMEDANEELPHPTDIENISLDVGQSVLQIHCDTLQYRRDINSAPYKKTISIPRWMYEEAVRLDIPCSLIFRKALAKEIGIS